MRSWPPSERLTERKCTIDIEMNVYFQTVDGRPRNRYSIWRRCSCRSGMSTTGFFSIPRRVNIPSSIACESLSLEER